MQKCFIKQSNTLNGKQTVIKNDINKWMFHWKLKNWTQIIPTKKKQRQTVKDENDYFSFKSVVRYFMYI